MKTIARKFWYIKHKMSLRSFSISHRSTSSFSTMARCKYWAHYHKASSAQIGMLGKGGQSHDYRYADILCHYFINSHVVECVRYKGVCLPWGWFPAATPFYRWEVIYSHVFVVKFRPTRANLSHSSPRLLQWSIWELLTNQTHILSNHPMVLCWNWSSLIL